MGGGGAHPRCAGAAARPRSPESADCTCARHDLTRRPGQRVWKRAARPSPRRAPGTAPPPPGWGRWRDGGASSPGKAPRRERLREGGPREHAPRRPEPPAPRAPGMGTPAAPGPAFPKGLRGWSPGHRNLWGFVSFRRVVSAGFSPRARAVALGRRGHRPGSRGWGAPGGPRSPRTHAAPTSPRACSPSPSSRSLGGPRLVPGGRNAPPPGRRQHVAGVSRPRGPSTGRTSPPLPAPRVRGPESLPVTARETEARGSDCLSGLSGRALSRAAEGGGDPDVWNGKGCSVDRGRGQGMEVAQHAGVRGVRGVRTQRARPAEGEDPPTIPSAPGSGRGSAGHLGRGGRTDSRSAVRSLPVSAGDTRGRSGGARGPREGGPGRRVAPGACWEVGSGEKGNVDVLMGGRGLHSCSSGDASPPSAPSKRPEWGGGAVGFPQEAAPRSRQRGLGGGLLAERRTVGAKDRGQPAGRRANGLDRLRRGHSLWVRLACHAPDSPPRGCRPGRPHPGRRPGRGRGAGPQRAGLASQPALPNRGVPPYSAFVPAPRHQLPCPLCLSTARLLPRDAPRSLSWGPPSPSPCPLPPCSLTRGGPVLSLPWQPLAAEPSSAPSAPPLPGGELSSPRFIIPFAGLAKGTQGASSDPSAPRTSDPNIWLGWGAYCSSLARFL